MASNWTRRLVALGACREAVAWAGQHDSLTAAWVACERGDWMLWLAGAVAGPPGDDSRRPLALAACACARLALPRWETRYPNDRRPRATGETIERWARGEGPTLAEVQTAAFDAAAAADAAADAYAAADAVAYAAAAAIAYAAAAAYAYAAAAALADTAADAAARTRVLRECADLVRQHYPEPPDIGGRHGR